MSISGGCDCNNIKITWHVVDYSVVARACQCDYCLSMSAAYVTKAGTKFEVLIHREKNHRKIQHGSNSAVFHECANCNRVVFVTAEIEDKLYGALNANHLNNKFGFSASVKANFGWQTAEQKRARWRQNWCHPIRITIATM
jgi:hypothetical protein